MPPAENDRTQTARDHDDSDIIDNAGDAPGQSGSAGGNVARAVGARDEEAGVAEGEGDARVTRVQNRDKEQPATQTRSDHEGAQS